MPFYGTVLGKQKITLCFASYPSRVGNWGVPQFALPIARRSWQTVCQNIPWPNRVTLYLFFSTLIVREFLGTSLRKDRVQSKMQRVCGTWEKHRWSCVCSFGHGYIGWRIQVSLRQMIHLNIMRFYNAMYIYYILLYTYRNLRNSFLCVI